jgi:hypothetical protein
VVFVHLLRRPGAAYVSYWFYYPRSLTAHLPVAALRGEHRDDWEGAIVRVDARGTAMRVSAHGGFAGLAPWWASEPGWRPVAPHPRVFRASGSHANGFGEAALDLAGDRWNGTLGEVARFDLEPADEAPAARRRFDPEATAPWRKRVWRDPELPSTAADGSRGLGTAAARAWATMLEGIAG